MGRTIDPPKVAAFASSWEFLKKIGAINEDDTITALGRAMVCLILPSHGTRLYVFKALLPVDVKLAKVGTFTRVKKGYKF